MPCMVGIFTLIWYLLSALLVRSGSGAWEVECHGLDHMPRVVGQTQAS